MGRRAPRSGLFLSQMLMSARQKRLGMESVAVTREIFFTPSVEVNLEFYIVSVSLGANRKIIEGGRSAVQKNGELSSAVRTLIFVNVSEQG